MKYAYDALVRPSEVMAEETKVKQSAEEMRNLKNRLKNLEDENIALKDQVKEKDGQIDKFANSYMTIAKFMSDNIKSNTQSDNSENPLTG